MTPNETLPSAPAHRPVDPGRVALVILAILAVGTVITQLGQILKPFVLAIFLFFITRSAAAPLVRFGLPRWLALLVLFIVTMVVVCTVFLFVYGEAMQFRNEWPGYQAHILDMLGREKGEAAPTLREIFKLSSHDIFSFVFEQGVHLAEIILMTLFYLLFLILGSRKLASRVQRAFPGETGQRVLAICEKIGNGMEQFMRIKTVVSAGMALSAGLVMYLMGLPHALLWAFLFFALNYITYIGGMFACVPPIALAYIALPSMAQATVLAILLIVIRFLWTDLVEVRWSGKHLNIDSALLFLWLAYWGWAWGVLGLILAYPSLVTLKIVLENLEQTRECAVLMSED
jgi:predicted PurR-regulated permease PerM